MSMFYRITDPDDVRDLSEQMPAWLAAGNPKAAEWAEQPVAPSPDAVWRGGQWVTPPAPTFTAEGWLDAQQYGGSRPTSLLYFKMRLEYTLANSPKLDAVQSWLDGIIAVGAQDPDAQHADLPAAPFAFAEVCQEALQILQQP